MANQFKSFYLEDIITIIDRLAMESMMIPVFEGKKPDGMSRSLAEISNYNSLIAMNNEGIRDFAIQLKEALRKEAEAGDSDD